MGMAIGWLKLAPRSFEARALAGAPSLRSAPVRPMGATNKLKLPQPPPRITAPEKIARLPANAV